MTPALSVLQLDTRFPRLPGDVASPETYRRPIEIIRVSGAEVPKIVRRDPARIDIRPFEQALAKARGDLVATSCGFLSFWQDHLAARTQHPFIASALFGLPRLTQDYHPEEVLIVTFDAQSLGPGHMAGHEAFAARIAGLLPSSHLRRAIETNGPIDPAQAEAELCDLVAAHKTRRTRAILFECTNLPPYAAKVRAQSRCAVFSILTELERCQPGLVQPSFL